jgi:hypothetical protein
MKVKNSVKALSLIALSTSSMFASSSNPMEALDQAVARGFAEAKVHPGVRDGCASLRAMSAAARQVVGDECSAIVEQTKMRRKASEALRQRELELYKDYQSGEKRSGILTYLCGKLHSERVTETSAILNYKREAMKIEWESRDWWRKAFGGAKKVAGDLPQRIVDTSSLPELKEWVTQLRGAMVSNLKHLQAEIEIQRKLIRALQENMGVFVRPREFAAFIEDCSSKSSQERLLESASRSGSAMAPIEGVSMPRIV